MKAYAQTVMGVDSPFQCGLTKQANRRPHAGAKPRMRDVRVERRVGGRHAHSGALDQRDQKDGRGQRENERIKRAHRA